MVTIILILFAIVLLGLGGGVLALVLFKQRKTIKHGISQTQQAPAAGVSTFRWRYIILPLAILALAMGLVAFFYRLLPAEVAYLFRLDGAPAKWLGREMLIVGMLVPQLLLTLLAAALTWGIGRLNALFRQQENALVKPESVLFVMGNMIALPQLVLCFAMLDIFSYNAYEIHLIPLWTFALIVMGLGAIALGLFFIQVMFRVWAVSRKITQQKS